MERIFRKQIDSKGKRPKRRPTTVSTTKPPSVELIIEKPKAVVTRDWNPRKVIVSFDK